MLDFGRYTSQVYTGGLSPQEFTRLFKGIIFACIMKRAEAVAGLTFNVYRKSVKQQLGKELVEPDHWLVKLLDKPNQAEKSMTKIGLLLGLEMWMSGFGRTFWYTPKNGTNYPVQIWEIPANTISPVPGSGRLIGGFQWMHPTLGNVTLPPEEVVFFRRAVPQTSMWSNLTTGYSLFHAAADAVIIDANTMEYLRNDLENGTMPPYFVKSPNKVDPKEWNMWKAQLVDSFTGSNAERTPAMLPNNWDIGTVNLLGNKEALIAMGEHNLHVIYSVTGVPEGMLTGSFDANAPAASFNALRYTFHENTIESMAIYYDQILTNWVQQFDPMLIVAHEPLAWKDPNEIRADEQHRLSTGRATIDDLRKENGEETIGKDRGGETLFIDPKLQPLDSVLAGKVQPPAQTKITVQS